MTQTQKPLMYRGTDIPVRLGDRVIVRSLLGKKRSGIVSYVPGQSYPPHPQMEAPDFYQWSITFDSGDSLIWAYVPDQIKASRRITFVSRGPAPEEDLLPPPDQF